MRDWLTEKLGGFGLVAYILVCIAISVLPVVMLQLPFWAMALIIIAVYMFPMLNVPLWIAGFIGTLCGPQDTWAVIYYIVFAVAAVSFIIRFTTSMRNNR